MTHISASELIIIGSDNGLAPGRSQTIIWTIDGLLLIGPLGTNFSEIIIGIQTISFKKMHLKMTSAKWCPFCLGLNVLINYETCFVMHAIILFECTWRSFTWHCKKMLGSSPDELLICGFSSRMLSGPNTCISIGWEWWKYSTQCGLETLYGDIDLGQLFAQIMACARHFLVITWTKKTVVPPKAIPLTVETETE